MAGKECVYKDCTHGSIYDCVTGMDSRGAYQDPDRALWEGDEADDPFTGTNVVEGGACTLPACPACPAADWCFSGRPNCGRRDGLQGLDQRLGPSVLLRKRVRQPAHAAATADGSRLVRRAPRRWTALRAGEPDKR